MLVICDNWVWQPEVFAALAPCLGEAAAEVRWDSAMFSGFQLPDSVWLQCAQRWVEAGFVGHGAWCLLCERT